MILALNKTRSRLARFGIALDLHVLPVVYAEIAPRLAALTQARAPDAILHFGLAARRKAFCVETRAMNRINPLHRDAAGAGAPCRAVIPGAAPIAKSTFPSSRIAAALARAGITAELSIDAGDYICNQTLYLSLAATRARSIGFIHVPRLARRSRSPAKARRPTLEEAMRAAVIAILAMAAQLRRDKLSINSRKPFADFQNKSAK